MLTDFIAKLNHREKLFVAAFLGALLLLFIDRVGLGPVLGQLKSQDAVVQAKLDGLKSNYRILSFRSDILNEADKYKPYYVGKEKNNEQLLSDTLREIETIAGQKLVTIANIRPGELDENPVSKVYSTTLECEGGLSNLLEFMSSLEESTYLFQVKAYDLVPKGKTGEVIKCNMSLVRSVVIAEQLP